MISVPRDFCHPAQSQHLHFWLPEMSLLSFRSGAGLESMQWLSVMMVYYQISEMLTSFEKRG